MTDRIDVRQGSSQQATPAMRPRLSPEAAERLDRLFRLYNARVLAVASTRARRPEDVKDIAGVTWVLACRYITGMRADDDHAMAWLARVVRTAARDFYKPRRARELPEDWTDAVASRTLPVAQAAESETDVFALAELSASQCTAVKLAAQGLSHSAIAARMGRSTGAVYTHIHRGARKLRGEDRPPLPVRPTPHERDGRQESPAPVPPRPHSRALALAGGGR